MSFTSRELCAFRFPSRAQFAISIVLSVVNAACLLFFTMGAGLGPQRRDTVEAREFLIRDADGHIRVSLRLLPDGNPALLLYDERDDVRLQLSSSSLRVPGSSGMTVGDGRASDRSFFGVNENGNAVARLSDADGFSRASLMVRGDNLPSLTLEDTKRMRLALRLDEDNLPVFALMDEQGKNRYTTRLDKNGVAYTSLNDKEERPRFVFHSSSDGSTGLSTFSETPKSCFNIATFSDGRPMLSLSSTVNNDMITLGQDGTGLLRSR